MQLIAIETKKHYTVVVPPGKYVLGDPCYCFSGTNAIDHWEVLGESCNWWQDHPIASIQLDGIIYDVLAFSTKYGDGTYLDNMGREYSVDAGLIGLVPYELFKAVGGELMDRMHYVVEFKASAMCTDNDGDMRFGKYHINTQGYADDD
jgi:hypothetical protein